MMRLVVLFSFFCVLNFTSALCMERLLFEIGKRDHSAAEFALSPDGYSSFLAQFGGEKSYYVGYSSPDKHWPYILPGPLDGWAGGGYWAGFYPRHFPSIYFQIDRLPRKGECSFSFFFTGLREGQDSTRMRFEINGYRFEKTFSGKDSDALLKGETSGHPDEWHVVFPVSYLKKGMNRIRLGSVKGRWAMFDCLRFFSPEGVRLGSAGSTLIRSVETAPYEYKKKNGSRVLPIRVDLIQFDESKKLTFRVGKRMEVTQYIEKGEHIQEILIPALSSGERPGTETIEIRDGDRIIYTGEVMCSSARVHTPSDDVDLLMGTGNSRWMFKPGPCLPLSMVQIAPDNQDETWKAGYEYTVENIMGFNHFCDWTMTGFLMQPTCGELRVDPGREDFPDEGYRSRIDKSSEQAEVGKYSVFMTDTKIKAEITSMRRSALQRYTFPERNDSRILIDMFTPNEYPHNLVNAKITKVSDTEIEGFGTYYNAFTGYSLEQSYTVYFVLQFSRPFDSMGGWVNNSVKPVTGYIGGWNRTHVFENPAEIRQNVTQIEGGGDVGVFVNFRTTDQESILVRSGVSLVDIQGARNNLKQEISDPFNWNFDQAVKFVRSVWDEYLGRIEIETDDYLQKKKFYTNLYRALAAKAIWSDIDGRFTDENEKICRLENAGDAIVSGEYWNTFWNNQQLFNLIAPEISSKWARSAIQLYRNSGWFNTDPAGVEHTGVMVAMHVISQILSAWQSGIRDFNLPEAYTGLKKMMTIPPRLYEGGGTVGVEHLLPYMKYGYIPFGKGTVSNTLEYAYDDWCLGQMAKVLGQESDYQMFDKRSDNWTNLFDDSTRFIRPKNENGDWIEPFDPYHTPGFTEGNAFNYSWFVPHNPEKLIRLVGRERFVERLNGAMERSSHANFNAAGDNFSAFPINHGNETSMEVAYLFNWAGVPWLTQKWVRAIQEQYYGITPYDAYPGDEDLGQMSAWFVMSALGLFQMDGGCSAEPYYELGSPRYPKISIYLDGKYGRGQVFEIEAPGASAETKYIRSVRLNGLPITGFRIPVSEVLKGGKAVIEMSKEPMTIIK